MKSMDMEFQGFSGIGKLLEKSVGLWHTGLAWNKWCHDLQ